MNETSESRVKAAVPSAIKIGKYVWSGNDGRKDDCLGKGWDEALNHPSVVAFEASRAPEDAALNEHDAAYRDGHLCGRCGADPIKHMRGYLGKSQSVRETEAKCANPVPLDAGFEEWNASNPVECDREPWVALWTTRQRRLAWNAALSTRTRPEGEAKVTSHKGWKRMKWNSVGTRKPSGAAKIKLLNVHWWNSIDEGDCNDFGYWSPSRGEWVHMDKNATSVGRKDHHITMVVTHWSEQPKPPNNRLIMRKETKEPSRG